VSYRVVITRSAEKELDRLPEPHFGRLAARILDLERVPRPRGCRKLQGSDGWRLRVADYRVLYDIDDAAKVVKIAAVLHRSVAYRR